MWRSVSVHNSWQVHAEFAFADVQAHHKYCGMYIK